MKELEFPFGIKVAAGLISVALIIVGIVYGSSFLFTLYFAFLLSLLLRPVVKFFERLHIPSAIAIIITLIIAFSIFLLIIYGIMSQFSSFVSDWPSIKENILLQLNNLQKWIASELSISKMEQETYMRQATSDMEGGTKMIKTTLLSVKDFLLDVLLMPIYTFLILYYHRLLTHFLLESFGEANIKYVTSAIAGVKKVIQSYIVGLMIQLTVVSTLDSVGLMIVGIKYAVLLGVMAGFLNLIPYIGTLSAGIIAVLVGFSTGADLSHILGIVAVFSLVQFIDNNILMPNIVGGKVKVNALASIVGVVIGGAIGGVAGMFLAIPTIAILKVVFDHTHHLKNWGILLGDEIPHKPIEMNDIKNFFNKISIYPASASVHPTSDEGSNENLPPAK